MFCPNCGSQVDENATSFCPNCGAPVNNGQANPGNNQNAQNTWQQAGNYQQPNYQQDAYQQYAPGNQYNPNGEPPKGMAIGSLVCSIAGLIFVWFGYFSILSLALGIVAVVLGVLQKKKYGNNGMATAGVVMGIITIVLSGIVFVSCVACSACVGCSSLMYY